MCWRTVNIFSYVSTFCGLILKFSLTLKFSVCNIDWVFWDLGCFINLESRVTRTMVSPAVVAMQYCTIGLLDTSYMSMTRLVVAQYVSFSCIFIDDKFQLFDYLYSQQVHVTFLPKNTGIFFNFILFIAFAKLDLALYINIGFWSSIVIFDKFWTNTGFVYSIICRQFLLNYFLHVLEIECFWMRIISTMIF